MADDDEINIRVAIRNARAAQRDLERLATRGVKKVGTEADRTGRKARVAGRSLNAMGKASMFAGRRMRGAVGGAIALAGAYVGFTAVKGAITTTMDFTKSVVGLQKATGLETDAAAKWVGLTKVRGVQAKALNMGMVTLAKNMRQARDEGSDQARMFDQLGVSQQAIQDRDMPRTLMEMADGLASMKSQSEQAAVGATLLGRGWQSMLPLLRGGGKELHALMKEADQLGVGMDDLSRDKLMEMVQAQRKVQLGALGLRLAFTKAAAPALLDFQKAGVAAMKVLNDPDLTGEQKLDKLLAMGERMGDRIGKGMERADFGDNMANAFERAFPRIAETAGRTAGKFTWSFVKGWWNADPASQLFVVGLLAMKLGVFRALGGGAAKMFIARFAPRLAAAMGVTMAAEGAVGSAITGRMGPLGGRAGRLLGAGVVAGALIEIGLHKDEIQGFLKDTFDIGLGPDRDSPGREYGASSSWWEPFVGGIPGVPDGRPVRGGVRRRRGARRPRVYNQPQRPGAAAPDLRNPWDRRGSSLRNPRTTKRSAVGPEIVVPVTVMAGNKALGTAVGRAKLRDEALSGERWGS